MALGYGLLLLIGTAVMVVALTRRSAALLLTGVGLTMYAYWLAVLTYNLWVPEWLLGYWHQWGIVALLLLVTGALSLAVNLFRAKV